MSPAALAALVRRLCAARPAPEYLDDPGEPAAWLGECLVRGHASAAQHAELVARCPEVAAAVLAHEPDRRRLTVKTTTPAMDPRAPSRMAARRQYSLIGHNGTVWVRVATAATAAEIARAFLAALPAYARLRVYDPTRAEVMMSEASATALAPPDPLPELAAAGPVAAAPAPAPALTPAPAPAAPPVPAVPPGVAPPRPALTQHLSCKITAPQLADLDAMRLDPGLWPDGYSVDRADVVRAAIDAYRETWHRRRAGQQLAIPGT